MRSAAVLAIAENHGSDLASGDDVPRLPSCHIAVHQRVLGTKRCQGGLVFAMPLLGTLAAAGLVLYFLGALIAHLRVGSKRLVGWAVFFSTAVAALAVNLGYHM